MIKFIIVAILMSVTVGSFISLMLVNIFLENGKAILKWILGIIIAILIGCTISNLIVREQANDKAVWNNGYCIECGNKWRFANADNHRNVGTIYYWTCDNCGKVIELHSNFK